MCVHGAGRRDDCSVPSGRELAIRAHRRRWSASPGSDKQSASAVCSDRLDGNFPKSRRNRGYSGSGACDAPLELSGCCTPDRSGTHEPRTPYRDEHPEPTGVLRAPRPGSCANRFSHRRQRRVVEPFRSSLPPRRAGFTSGSKVPPPSTSSRSMQRRCAPSLSSRHPRWLRQAS